MVMLMRGDKNTHSKGEQVKIPLLPNNVGKRAGQQGHENKLDISFGILVLKTYNIGW